MIETVRPFFVEGKTLNDTYFQLLYGCYNYGRKVKITNGSFQGATRLEFDYCAGMVKYPHIRPLAPIMPEGIPPTTTDEKIDDYFVDYLMNPVLGENEEYKYAQWINGHVSTYPDFCNKINCPSMGLTRCHLKNSNLQTCPLNLQKTPIEWVIDHFQQKGYGTNHCYITVGDASSNFAYDRPYTNEFERGTSPCLRGIDFKIKDGYLLTNIIYRSWDLYSGWPENMGGFTLLSEYVASQLDGVEAGEMMFSSSGLHCYDFQIDSLESVLGKN